MRPIDVRSVGERETRAGDKGSPPAHYASLGALEREAFAMIARGVADRRAAFHTPVFVTHGRDGFPAARTVVLRDFRADDRIIVIHTDRRSGKMADLDADPRAAAVFYDAKAKIQIRVSGVCTTHHLDETARGAWRRVPVASRRVYLGAAPGDVSAGPTSGLPEGLESAPPDLEESEAGFERFSLIHMRIRALEWLYLSARGHRRARLSWIEGEDGAAADWLAP